MKNFQPSPKRITNFKNLQRERFGNPRGHRAGERNTQWNTKRNTKRNTKWNSKRNAKSNTKGILKRVLKAKLKEKSLGVQNHYVLCEKISTKAKNNT